MNTPPTILIEDTDFNSAYARAVRYVIRAGAYMVIGSKEDPKPIRDSCMTISLTGNAIQQIENREMHPQFPFQHIDPYCEEFTIPYLSKYLAKPSEERFSYIYIERLVRYGDIAHGYTDQLLSSQHRLREEIQSGISSNRHQSITWRPSTDILSNASPCLQRIWIRYLGDHDVEVHLTWRSRDLYTAWQVNIIALIDMLNREVIEPNMCRIRKVVDYADSMHIYKSDLPAAKDVKPVQTNPQTRR